MRTPKWLTGLTHKDFLKDGHPIRQEDWGSLNWSKAWVDKGPSPAGNTGPYWHVPHLNGETVHRLYPKVLQTKWGPLLYQAVLEASKES